MHCHVRVCVFSSFGLSRMPRCRFCIWTAEYVRNFPWCANQGESCFQFWNLHENTKEITMKSSMWDEKKKSHRILSIDEVRASEFSRYVYLACAFFLSGDMRIFYGNNRISFCPNAFGIDVFSFCRQSRNEADKSCISLSNFHRVLKSVNVTQSFHRYHSIAAGERTVEIDMLFIICFVDESRVTNAAFKWFRHRFTVVTIIVLIYVHFVVTTVHFIVIIIVRLFVACDFVRIWKECFQFKIAQTMLNLLKGLSNRLTTCIVVLFIAIVFGSSIHTVR